MHKQYDELKDSGIEWLGEIPSHWGIASMKNSFKVKSGKEVFYENDFNIPNSIDVFGSGGIFKKTYQHLYDGESVLFGRKGTIGKPLYVNGKFWTVDTMYYTYFKKEMYPKYFFYLLQIYPWNKIATSTALPSIVGTDIENSKSIIPFSEEQKSIGDYLDEKTAKIDTLIEKKESLIKLLKEKRQVLINETVTKGLNPNAKMKDSGIDWIGEIPEHWSVDRIGRNTKIINGHPFNSDLFNSTEGYPLVRIRDLSSDSLETFYKGEIVESAIVKNEDILVGMDGDFNVCFWSKGFALLNQRVLSIVPNVGFDRKFLYYMISTPLKVINDLTYFTTVKHLSSVEFAKTLIPVPPLEEQENISKYLEVKTNNINQSINALEKQIKYLKEYRQTLIFNAVTGKIDVR